ncbi:potassium channel family protein [Cellulomonas edaphi]|uniref:Potassium channel family protein n=1 Tax=Cellulomonas edaphi TaxID=3053468 RepID=A0ABT7S6T4_9CELL|nr:potassium channel family protein [Cellulomons edaphi]MDM7831330.1 potassium channel family protein [Cellulomons edaphi]
MTARDRMRLRTEPDHFGLVLLLLVTTYVLFVLGDGVVVRLAVGAMYLVALVIAVRASAPGPRLRRFVQVVVVGAAVAIVVAEVALPREAAAGVTDCALAVVLISTLVCILDRLLVAREVTLRLIAGALSAYLIVGMMFANFFGIIAWLQPGPFFVSDQAPDAEALQYFSFVTLTTLGYGDLTATGNAGRGLAALEALVGQVFLATLIARMVSSFRRKERDVTPSEEAEDRT